MQLTFGDAMRFRRDQLGYTQEELADLVGRDQSTVARWERQSRPPKDAYALAQLADALQIDEADLRAGRVRVGGPLASEQEARAVAAEDLIKRIARIRAPEVDPDEAESFLRLLLRLDVDEIRALRNQGELYARLKEQAEEQRRRAEGSGT